MNPKKPTPRHIKIKSQRILKAAREKQLIIYKRVLIRLAAHFSTETLQDKREWQEIYKVVKTTGMQPRLTSKALH